MTIVVSEESGVRYLHFGSDWVQGAMRVSRPWALELDYTREMMSCLLLHPEPAWPRHALLIGLGAGSLTKFLYRHRPRTRITVVEIDPEVVAVARQHFKLPGEDERLRIVIDDGVEFMARRGRHYDLILVDGFDADAKAGSLDTLPFYLDCRARLATDGMMVANLLSRRKDFRGSVSRIKEAFDGRALAFPSCDSGNAIAIAGVGEELRVELDELKLAAESLKRNSGLNLAPTIARLERSGACPHGVLAM